MSPAAVMAVGEPQSQPAQGDARVQPSAMEPKARLYRRMALDMACTAALGLAVLLVNVLARPYRRGFFCDDDSIGYPYKARVQVSDTVVAVVGLLLPPLVVLATEATRRGWSARGDAELLGWRPPLWLCRLYCVAGVFVVGAAFSQLVVDSAKYLVGRLRPHFLDVCQPTHVCSGHEYVVDYTCSGPDAAVIEEARLSFPSGHAALSFYAAVFTVMYLQAEVTWTGSLVLKHSLQAALVILAWYTALSRVTDHMHHWSDVLAGGCIGSLAAVLAVVFMSDLSGRRRTRGGQELTALLSKPSSVYVPAARAEHALP
ncbi:putative phosphatidate phosphatase [Bacillus rossius redtenbacheri]|uniref:putative phosphatidate phosphatase n=1 Tax=Bacillus rossius redtenbacheri TaxID=93214 RepID=UPI002FDC96C1